MRERFAIYYAPAADTPLWRFGTSWLGRDPETGADIVVADLPGLTGAARQEITESPRRYGFHATLKPPFRLARERSADTLHAELATFAQARRPFAAPALEVSALDGFLALTPGTPWPEMDALAADCVTTFAPFRAPPDDAERTRRAAAPLSARQAGHLERWGYPYVLDQFRFHMTLTGRLDDDVRSRVRTILADQAGDSLRAVPPVDGIALYHEAEPGAPFRLIARFPFAADG